MTRINLGKGVFKRIGRNLITSEGGKILGVALCNNNSVSEVELGKSIISIDYNEMGFEAMLMLGAEIKYNSKLTKLNIGKYMNRE